VLVLGIVLQKATEYRDHARECRALAANASRSDHKAALIAMAETWESLARMRVVWVAKEIEKKLPSPSQTFPADKRSQSPAILPSRSTAKWH
jgi:hypothetical protein